MMEGEETMQQEQSREEWLHKVVAIKPAMLSLPLTNEQL
jgi:hypothetical protein